MWGLQPCDPEPDNNIEHNVHFPGLLKYARSPRACYLVLLLISRLSRGSANVTLEMYHWVSRSHRVGRTYILILFIISHV
jgi:hypothetical protein